MIQPNLVIIGAQKSGTTSLYHYLRSHPEIFMSNPVKEPCYFMKSEFVLQLFRRKDRTVDSRQEALERYMLQGYEAHRYFGEASTYYTIGTNSEMHSVPARMKQATPAMKLIYVIRNPFDRIVSNYLHVRRAEYFDGDFRGFLNTGHYQQALLTSCYWYQLTAYLDWFPRQQIKVVLFEDLVRDCEGVMNELYDFLELQCACKVRTDVRNRSENRSSFDATELLFPVEAYRDALQVILPDVRKLEEFMHRELDVWDLSIEQWCDVTTVLRADHSAIKGA